MYNFEGKEVEVSMILRLRHINKYSQGMKNVDVADQLRETYRLHRNIQHRKWWLEIMFLALVIC